MELFEGQTISAPFLSDKAEVKKFEKRQGYYLLELILLEDHTFKSLRISESQLAQVKIESRDRFSRPQNGEDFFFWIEANRLRLAYQFDPLLAVNVSQVDPLPHQIEAVYSYVLKDPKIRFLIADDAGAGKTIMAGLALKELQYRNMADRILVVTPSYLKYQWMRELKEKFNTNFTIVNRNLMESFWGENIWEELNTCIVSLDFLRQDDILQTLQSARWDLVIVDEAHKMSAYGYLTRDGIRIRKTKRYRVGEVLSANSTHLLFLTATPHRGDEENFRLFLDLLRPGFFAKSHLLLESIEKKENPIFVRRLKEDMKKFDGHKIFPPRHVRTVSFSLTEQEKALYTAVTKYVKDYFDKAKENRSITFAMMMLQRRLTSSIFAILRSLQNRKKRLEELIKLPEKIRESHEYEYLERLTEEELEDMEEQERWKIEEKLEHLTIAKNIDEVKKEIEKISELIEIAEKVKEAEVEAKLVKLRDEVLANLENRKLLIFTEFKDTLRYLEQKLTSWGYTTNTIHGDMKIDSRIEAEKKFLHETQIMVATEAAGEGINLQFCSLMANYDIPWNPNRLEQRMGRIHRYKQDKEVFIYNMVSKDTREGQILERIFAKLDLMRTTLGSDRVFDVIGELIPAIKFSEIFRDAITGQRRMEEIYEIVDHIDEKRVKETIDRILMTGLATRHIDYSGILKRANEANENRLMPEYIEDYFLRAFKRFGGAFQKGDAYYRIDSVPFELRKLNADYTFVSKYGKIWRKYAHLTFDKKAARSHPEYEYIAPGHPLLEAVNEKVFQDMAFSNSVAVFADETNAREGVVWFVEGEVTDGLGQIAGKRIFSLFQDIKGEIHHVNPAILWDLTPVNNGVLDESLKRMLENEHEIEEYAVTEILFPYLSEMGESRKNRAAIKEKYGLRSLDYLLQESNDKILQYQQQLEEGKDMQMPIFNEERRKEDLEQKRANLLKEIRLESHLTVSEPKIIGVVAILPINRLDTKEGKKLPEHMTPDSEIEKIGMQVAMAFETKADWKVEDVHTENLGFDLRSTIYDEDGTFQDIRYIEVKARVKEGAIRISANEWKKAKRFQDQYWLYIVTFAGTIHPKLRRIQNPFQKFRLDEDIYATGYIIPSEKLELRADE